MAALVNNLGPIEVAPVALPVANQVANQQEGRLASLASKVVEIAKIAFVGVISYVTFTMSAKAFIFGAALGYVGHDLQWLSKVRGINRRVADVDRRERLVSRLNKTHTEIQFGGAVLGALCTYVFHSTVIGPFFIGWTCAGALAKKLAPLSLA